MANVLKMATLHSILTLHERGWSQRRIARELGVDRGTVARYVRRDSKAATNAPTGSEPRSAAAETASSAGQASPGRAPGPVSQCEPHQRFIEEQLDAGLTSQRIWQDLVADHGDDAPSYYSVRRFVRRLQAASGDRGGRVLPYRRMECEPGVEAQVDFGAGAPVIDANGKRRKTHVLRVVLSHSRKAYSESVFRQTTENFIRCIENALHHFGGAVQALVIDNLRAAVKRADWFDPEINPKVQSFCKHYGMVVLPTKPYTPRHKGKVEKGIDYVKDNGLKGRTFGSLDEQNRHLLHWETTIADTRIHGTTKKQVGKLFTEVERPALQPLPCGGRFPFFHEGQRSVNRDGHVEVGKAYYSAPPEYLGRRVWARWDSRTVRLFNHHMEQIAIHVRSEPGRFRTDNRHIASEKISSIERGATWLLQKASSIGANAQRWSEAVLQVRGIEGMRVLQGLISLSARHDRGCIDRVCAIALAHEAFRLRTLRELIKRDAINLAEQQTLAGFLDEHPIIRSLNDYGQFVHNAFTQETHS